MDQPKRSPFDNLSKEELIKKCKGLLGIAQKAKQAKEDLIEENKQLKDDLQNYETQKTSDKKCLKAMQEIVDELTENKLNSATIISDMKMKIVKLEKLVEEHNDVKEKFDKISIENTALTQQLARLTQENNELLAQYEDLEKISIEHQVNLKMLENNQTAHIEDMTTIANLKKELEAQAIIEKEHITELQKVRAVNSNLLETKHKNDKLEMKLTNYKKKLIEFSQKLKQLKQSRNLLIEIVQDYSQTIPKWQKELVEASVTICNKVKVYEDENITLKLRINELESELENFTKKSSDTVDSKDSIQNDQIEELTRNVNDKTQEIELIKLEIAAQTKKEMQVHDELNLIIEQTYDQLKAKDLEIESLKLQKDLNESETIHGLQNQIRELEQLQENQKEMDLEINELKSILEENSLILSKKQSEIEELSQNLIAKTTEIESIKLLKEQTDSDAMNKLKQRDSEIIALAEELNSNKSAIEHLREIEQQSINQKQIINDLNQSIAIKTEEIEAMKSQTNENEALMIQLHAEINRLQEAEKSYQIVEQTKETETENSDLLLEMKEMNQILMERGGVISMQQSKLSDYETKITELEQSLNTLRFQCVEKDKIIKELMDEVTSIKDRMNMSFGENQSEIISTSTISRAEESSRLRELEDSFEEKYHKLRLLAVKLKKKVSDQTLQLQKYESDEAIAGNSLKLGTIQAKGLQSLQQENDKLLDEIELLKVENKKLMERSDKVTVEGGGSDESKNAIKEYQNQIKNLKKELEAYNLCRKEHDSEIGKLKTMLESKEKDIKNFVEKEKALKSELDKTKAAVKKTNVLSLEMDAYEKSLNDVTQKLETKNILIKELEATIDAQSNSIDSMKNQLKLIEENFESESNHSKDLKLQIDIQQNKLKERDHEKSELTVSLEYLTRDYENLKLEMDESKINLIKTISEKEKLVELLQGDKDKMVRQVYALEDSLETIKVNLNAKESEVEDIKTEFSNYKIRAQSVLRQNQTKDSSHENELEEENQTLQRTVDSLSQKLKSTSAEYENLSKTLNDLRDQEIFLKKKIQDLQQMLEDLRLQNEQIIEDVRKQNREHQDIIKTQRIQIETLNSCYKKQIEEIEEEFNKKIENLNHENLAVKQTLLTPKLDESRRIVPFSLDAISGGGGGIASGTTTTDEHRISMLLLEREDGEGSESTSNQINSGGNQQPLPKKQTRNKHELIPLDELLNSPFEESIIEEQRPVSPTVELKGVKENLVIQESRVKHLTHLLAEAEQDLARLTQLNDVLKEEVRKQQRDLDREKHIHNSEYIKNVILKFLTLNSGDEKTHLVPVLNTLLKLSPEETNKLQLVAKGNNDDNDYDEGMREIMGYIFFKTIFFCFFFRRKFSVVGKVANLVE